MNNKFLSKLKTENVKHKKNFSEKSKLDRFLNYNVFKKWLPGIYEDSSLKHQNRECGMWTDWVQGVIHKPCGQIFGHF